MSRSQAISKIINATKRLNYQPKVNNLIYGTVMNTEPLEIQIQQGVIIKAPHLILGEALRPHKVSMPHTHQYNGTTESTGGAMVAGTNFVNVTITGDAAVTNVTDSHSHEIKEQVTEDVHKTQDKNEKYVTIEMYPPLHKSDVVLMFAFNDFQKYYVAERVSIGDENTDYDT